MAFSMSEMLKSIWVSYAYINSIRQDVNVFVLFSVALHYLKGLIYFLSTRQIALQVVASMMITIS